MLLKAKVGPKGQAVIPKAIRDELGIRPGDEVFYSLHGGHAHLEKRPLDEQLDRFFSGLPSRGAGPGLEPGEFKRLLEAQYDDRLSEVGGS